MAASTRTFTIRINGVDQAINSVNELEENVRQLEEDLNGAQLGSAQFEQLRQELVGASSQLEEFRQAAEPITSAQVADGFVKLGQAVAGAVGLIGTGLVAFGASSEDVEKVQAKLQGVTAALESVKLVTEALTAENVRSISLALQSAQAWAQNGQAVAQATGAGATGIRGLGQSFLSLGKTLLTNPLFLIPTLIVGILAATGNLEKTLKLIASTLGKLFEPVAELVKRLGKEMKPLVDAFIEFLPPILEISTVIFKLFLPSMQTLLPLIEGFSKTIADMTAKVNAAVSIFKTSISTIGDFIGITNTAKKAQEDFDKTIEQSIAAQKDYEQANNITNAAAQRNIDILRASGASADVVNKAELALLKTKEEQAKAEFTYAKSLYDRIVAQGKAKDLTEDQIKSLLDIKEKYLNAAKDVTVKEAEIDTQARDNAKTRAKENKDAIDALKAQIKEQYKLSKIGLGLENLDQDLQDLEDKLKKIDQSNIAGIIEADLVAKDIVKARKAILDENFKNEKEKQEGISKNLKAELDKRTFIGKEGEAEKARLIGEIDDTLKNILTVNQSNLDQEKKKLDDDYKESVQKNSDKIVKINQDEAKKVLEGKGAELEGKKKANDKIADNEDRSAADRIEATKKSAGIQREIIENNAAKALIGLKEGSKEYEAIIKKRDEDIVENAEKTQDKIDEIDAEARAKRKAKILKIASDSVAALSELVNIANQVIDSMAAEVDARIEESQTRISALQTLQDDLLSQQNTLEDELQNARGQRAEDLLAQINNLSSARSQAAAQEQAQNAILAEQEEKKARLAKASAIATAIQTTAQAGLAVATSFAANAAYPIVGIISALAFVSSLIGSIAAIKNAAKFEKGGMIDGNLHKDGGTIVEAEKGEFIVNRRAVQNNIGLLRQINSEGSTRSLARKYENGGSVGVNDSTFNALNANTNSEVSQNIKQLNSRIDELAARPVIVAVQDINDGQKGYAKIKNSVSF